MEPAGCNREPNGRKLLEAGSSLVTIRKGRSQSQSRTLHDKVSHHGTSAQKQRDHDQEKENQQQRVPFGSCGEDPGTPGKQKAKANNKELAGRFINPFQKESQQQRVGHFCKPAGVQGTHGKTESLHSTVRQKKTYSNPEETIDPTQSKP